MSRPHYLAMSGSHGCLPDYLEVHDRWSDAVTDLARLFELTPQAVAVLRSQGILELTPHDGADYCQVERCDCPALERHGAA